MTRAQWEQVKPVLAGEGPEGCSLRTACRVAGVAVAEVRELERLSRNDDEPKEPWVSEIAPFLDALPDVRADRVLDVLWARALHGTPTPVVYKGKVTGEKVVFNDALLVRLAEHVSPEFRASGMKTKGPLELTGTAEDPEAVQALFERFKAHVQLQQMKAERGGAPIDVTPQTPTAPIPQGEVAL